MSFIKQFLMVSALVAAISMPNRAYARQMDISVGDSIIYAGVTAVCAYIIYSWATQETGSALTTPALTTDDDMYGAVLETFKQGSEDPYEDHLDQVLREDGYRIYVKEDQDKMVEFFEAMRNFIDPIKDLPSKEQFHDQIDALAIELEAELLISRDNINIDARNSFGARAARASYYADHFNEIIRQAALQPIVN